MIFTQPLYGKVLRGEKGRGIQGEAHITFTAVRREPLGAIDFDAARAEGFKTTDDFRLYWMRLHDKACGAG